GAEGIVLEDGANNTAIGGTTGAERNVISGNTTANVWFHGSTSNTVLGTFIGTTANGNTAVTGTTFGVVLSGGATQNTIGASFGTGNVISGATTANVYLGPLGALGSGNSNNTVEGNAIGTDPTGSSAVGHSDYGVLLVGGTETTTDNLIGGPGLGNVI